MAQKQNNSSKTAKSKPLRKKPAPKDNLKGLITFVLIFGIIGGAYLIYKTFAAGVTPIAYVSQIYAAAPGPKPVAKNNSSGGTTWQVPPNASIGGNIYLPFLKPNSPFSVCANILSTSGGSIGLSLGAAGSSGVNTLKLAASKSYHKQCSKMNYIDAYTARAYQPGVSNFSKTKNIYVDWIDFEYASQYVSGGYTSIVSH